MQNHRVVFVQFGDFRQGYARLQAREPETYYGQTYSLRYVAGLTQHCEFVGVASLGASVAYSERLEDGLAAAGVPIVNGRVDMGRLEKVLEAWRPTHLVLRTPEVRVVRWCLKAGIAVLPIFADSFSNTGLRWRLANANFARLLNRPEVTLVANHNLPASRSLEKIGVAPAKIVPWDWPYDRSPGEFPVKSAPHEPLRLFYVGAISEAKGVFDLIRAAGVLKRAGRSLHLDIVGDGALGDARTLARSEGVASETIFHGAKPNTEVIDLLGGADIAVVPTRPAFGEGMPKSINEALLTRTPLVLSDHPIFEAAFANSAAAKFFRAGDEESLAQAVAQFADNRSDFSKASAATRKEWDNLLFGAPWARVIDVWLHGGENLERLLRDASLASPAVARKRASASDAAGGKNVAENASIEERTQDQPLVSVVIVTRNRHELVERAVRSVLDQTYRPIEIVLIDNQSEPPVKRPETADGVSVVLARTPSPLNSSEARNLGVDRSSGDLVSFLDDDDFYFPKKTEAQVAAFVQNPEIEVAYMNTKRVDHNGKELSIMVGAKDLPVMRHIHLNALMVSREAALAERFDERLTQNVDDHLIYRLFDRYPWEHVKEIGAVWNYDNRPDQITYHSFSKKFRGFRSRYSNSKVMCEDFAEKFDQEKSLRKNYYGRHSLLALMMFKPLEAARYYAASIGVAGGPRRKRNQK